MLYCFDDYTLDEERFELRCAGRTVTIEPRAFQVLLYLLQQRDRVVSKDELIEQCWPGTFVSESALSQCLTRIRRVVRTGRSGPPLIQTVYGVGYRFVAPVTMPSGAPADPVPIEQPPPPPQFLDLLPLRQPASPELPMLPQDAERRRLTVLHCALVDAPRLAHLLDPEQWHTAIHAFHAVCEAIVLRFDGYLAQYLSDSLVVYFGYPQAHDDDPQRAIRSGLAIVDTLKREPLMALPENEMRLRVRIGVHTGLAVIDVSGEREAQAPLAIGNAPTVAVALQDLAVPNGVVISAATAQLVEGYFTCQVVGNACFAGSEESLTVYQVLRETGVRDRLEVRSIRKLTPLVGREAEIAVLRDRWAQVKRGRGQVVLLSGEPGKGKSRLVQVMKGLTAGQARIQLECRCAPYYQHTAFYPLIELLQHSLDWPRLETAEQKLKHLEGALQQYRMPLAETVPLFAALLSLPLPEGRYPPLTFLPQRQKQKMLEAMLAVLLALARQGPVLFVVEDLHWADPSTLELLDLLMARGPTASICTILTCRPEFTPPWGLRSHLTSMTLQRLSRQQVQQMIIQMTDGNGLPPEMMDQVIARSDGVPLFVEELTKTVLASGLPVEQLDRYGSLVPIQPPTIPLTLHDSLMARLDRLGAAKAVAQLGAIIGRQFTYDLLQAVSPFDDVTLRDALGRLIDAELLYLHGMPPQVAYIFKHALLQEAASESLLTSTRRQYHQQIAHTLETRFPETVTSEPELLAHHYTEAGLVEPALPYWQQAGACALGRGAVMEAVSHLQRGLQVIKILPDTPVRSRHELPLQMLLAPTLMVTKSNTAPEVEHVFVRARELSQQLGAYDQLFQAQFGLWLIYALRAEYANAKAQAEQLLHLSEQQDHPGFIMGACVAVGYTLFYLGEPVAGQVYFERALVLQHNLQQPAQLLFLGMEPVVFMLGTLAQLLWVQGYPEQAQARAQEACAMASQLSHAPSLAFAQAHATFILHLCGQLQAALDLAEKGIALATEQGFTTWAAANLMYRGWVLAQQGHTQAGMTDMQQGFSVFYEELGARTGKSFHLALFAEMYGKSGNAAEGLRMLAEAQALAEESGEGWHVAELHRLQGELLLQKGGQQSRVDAAACFQQALTIAHHQQAKGWELRAAISLARLWQQQGKWQAARRLMSEVYDGFTEGFDTADLQKAGTLLEELAWPEDERG